MLRIILILLYTVSISVDLLGNESIRTLVQINPDIFLSEDKFSYYDDKLTIRFDLVRTKLTPSFSVVLLTSETSRKENICLILDTEPQDTELDVFYGKNMLLRKEVIKVDSTFFQTKQIPLFIEFDVRKDVLRLSVNTNDTIEFNEAGLSVDDGYKFAIHLDTIPSKAKAYPALRPAIMNFKVEAYQDSRKGNSIFWYVFIIILDIFVFAYMYYRHRKRKREGQTNLNEVSLSSPAFLNKPLLPTKSAIFLFGGMRVYNRDGEDISKKFSPILKELLSLLIVHSDKKGISAEKMKSYLWADKTIASARNNRAVNLGKLRNLLSEVGNFEIKSDDGYWRIDTNDTFIDYLQYRTILKTPGLLSRSDIELLCSITSEGNILPEQDYEWLDELKGAISDDIFDKFLAYAETMNESSATDLYIGIADVMFKFESINEQALSLKCRAYSRSGRHSAAKIFYDKFCEEYKHVYGEDFPVSFSEIQKSNP
ncbi:MAG: AfsR/SARP family transcriptional regulator [Bacteroidales bacterium]